MPLPAGEVEWVDEEQIEDEDSDPEEFAALDGNDKTVSENLEMFGEQCDAFGWWPEEEKDVDSIRQFVRFLVDASHQAKSDQDEILEAKVQHWTNKVAENLGTNESIDTERQVEFNRRFARGARPEQPFIGFVFVSHAAISLQKIALDGTDPREAVGFELKGASDKFIANVKPEWPAMPTDSPWLVIGTKIPDGSIRLISTSGSEQLFDMAKVDYVFVAN